LKKLLNYLINKILDYGDIKIITEATEELLILGRFRIATFNSEINKF